MFDPSFTFKKWYFLLWTTCLIFICVASAQAQNTSNKGTDFWVAYAGHFDGTASRLTLFITSEFNASVTINAGGTALPVVSIPAKQSIPVVIDPNTYTNVYATSSGSVQSGKGIHLTSDQPIVVYALISKSARSAATLIFPTKSLGNEYYPISYTQYSGASRFSQFTMVGTEDGTVVEITPSQNSSTSPLQTAGIPFQITLNKGDIYQYQSATDISGSYIKTVGSCKPIAVFSGSTFTAFCEEGNPITAGTGDNLYQQLLSVSAWGKNFVTAPFYNTLNGNSDVYRIIVANDNTTVTVNSSTISMNGKTLTNPYSKGSILTFPSKTANVIEADKPISVAQFQTTQGCNVSNTPAVVFPGDPEMTILNPVEQTLLDVTVYSAISTVQAPTNITKHFINVIIKTADQASLKIDGNSFPSNSFKAINAQYSYLIYDVTLSSSINPIHRITADGGFSAIAYGYGSVESYAYLAGSDLKNLNKFVEAQNATNGSVAVSEGCVNQTYNFALTLPYITNSISWDLGNGESSTVNNPNYTTQTVGTATVYKYQYTGTPAKYINSGTFTIKASVINPAPSGCDANEIIGFDFNVYDLPIANFQVDSKLVCQGSTLTITDNSSGKGSPLKKWIWDFGDGTTETRTGPDVFTHTYSVPGDYKITLALVSETGCQSLSQELIIHVAKTPAANFDYSSLKCSNQPLAFTDHSDPGEEGTVVKWLWNFDDDHSTSSNPNSSAVQNPSHTFTQPGTYKVQLTVFTSNNCGNTITKDLIIYPEPKANFEMPDFCLNDGSAMFLNQSAITDGTESQFTFQWAFGDPTSGSNNTSTQKNPSHNYLAAGKYQVSLTVTSNNGCVNTLSKTFTVNGSIPKAAFNVLNKDQLCSNQAVEFEDLASVDFGEITKIEWNFDVSNPNDASSKITDINPNARNSPAKKYVFQYPVFHSPLTKTINVRMRVFSGESCLSETEKQIVLNAAPEVVFNTIQPVCEESAPFQITQASELYNIPGSGQFSGLGITSGGIFNPKTAGPGTHDIIYTFITNNGCTDQKSQTIIVNAGPEVSAGKDTVILEGGQIQLNGIATGKNLTYKWTPSTGLDQDQIPNPVAKPTEDIHYVLTVTSDEGCSVSDEVFIKVLKSPKIPNTFTPNGDGVNDYWNIQYLESYPGATITIFNRYGNTIFYSVGYSAPWDGNFNGIGLPTATYYYIINPKNGQRIFSGSISIIK